jgi:hypothetical protein
MTEPTPISPELSQWLAIRDEHIAQLEGEIVSLRQRLNQTAAQTVTAEQTRQQQLAQTETYQQRNAELQAEVQQWQENYEQLRIQKGGFGIKAMTIAGFTGVLLGLLVYRLVFDRPDAHAVAFEQFRADAGFQVEYALNQRQFEQANAILNREMERSKYQPIHAELDFMSSMVGATHRAFTEAGMAAGGSVNYAIQPANGDTALLIKPQRQLTITEDAAIVHVEAAFNSGVLVALKKKEKINQWDRTAELDKMKVIRDGVKGQAEDYWYEVETGDGYKGWLFGYYTNASLRRFKPDKVDSVLTKLDTTAKKLPKQP